MLGIFVIVPLMRTTIGPVLKHTLGFLPIFSGPNYGVGFLTAGIVLAIMVVPFIISVSREVLLTVPREQREAALGLGATRWEATWQVVVPWARTGVMGSIFLALARALGETMAVTMVIGNDPKIAASLFAPGYTIAAVIANEFTEATGNLVLERAYRTGVGALSDDVYFERARTTPDRGDRAGRGTPVMSDIRLLWRKSLNVVMLTLTGVACFAVVAVLFMILGYLIWNGGKSLNWAFFTQLPKPVGEMGGGMANAIVGSLKLLGLAALIGLPIGLLAGVYLAEFGGKYLLLCHALHNGPAERRAFDRDRHLRIFAACLAGEALLGAGRGRGAWSDGHSDHRARTEEFLRAVPGSMREGAMALGASKWRTIATVILPAASGGIITGMLLSLARVAGETAPLLFTAFSNRYWSPGWNQPIASLPVMIYTYAIAPYDDWHRQAWAAGLVLLALVLLANLGCRLVLNRRGAYRSV